AFLRHDQNGVDVPVVRSGCYVSYRLYQVRLVVVSDCGQIAGFQVAPASSQRIGQGQSDRWRCAVLNVPGRLRLCQATSGCAAAARLGQIALSHFRLRQAALRPEENSQPQGQGRPDASYRRHRYCCDQARPAQTSGRARPGPVRPGRCGQASRIRPGRQARPASPGQARPLRQPAWDQPGSGPARPAQEQPASRAEAARCAALCQGQAVPGPDIRPDELRPDQPVRPGQPGQTRPGQARPLGRQARSGTRPDCGQGQWLRPARTQARPYSCDSQASQARKMARLGQARPGQGQPAVLRPLSHASSGRSQARPGQLQPGQARLQARPGQASRARPLRSARVASATSQGHRQPGQARPGQAGPCQPGRDQPPAARLRRARPGPGQTRPGQAGRPGRNSLRQACATAVTRVSQPACASCAHRLNRSDSGQIRLYS
ncbi:glutenin, high molecular weight subunit DX5-like, partial [Penaeus japonicus]|uniref:glutenin, high molecular weight subunit DX5-like n=1 Tax=Penaeus japonicus TaxID=27405 RepID=UPI001C7115AE